MANKHMKKRLTPLVTKKMKPETRHLKPINLVTIKKFGLPSIDENVEKFELTYLHRGCKLV